MTRTELLALAERMHMMARAIQKAANSEPEARFGIDLQDSADLMIQIAESKPVGWACTRKNDGSQVFSESCLSSNPEYVRLYHDYNWQKVYTLPLED